MYNAVNVIIVIGVFEGMTRDDAVALLSSKVTVIIEWRNKGMYVC